MSVVLTGITDPQIDAEIASLQRAAVTALDACTSAKAIAFLNPEVRALFKTKCLAGYPFVGIRCLNLLGIPEYKYVLFEFDCQPDTLCLIKPSFLVTVNLVTGQVVPPIADPYIPSSYRAATPVSRSQGSYSGCGCEPSSRSTTDDPIDALKGIIDSVLGRGITCALVNRRCGNDQRCNRSFRKLENFQDNPTADTARDLADFMGASSMQERCVRAIIEEADTVDFIVFVAAVAAAAGA